MWNFSATHNIYKKTLSVLTCAVFHSIYLKSHWIKNKNWFKSSQNRFYFEQSIKNNKNWLFFLFNQLTYLCDLQLCCHNLHSLLPLESHLDKTWHFPSCRMRHLFGVWHFSLGGCSSMWSALVFSSSHYNRARPVLLFSFCLTRGCLWERVERRGGKQSLFPGERTSGTKRLHDRSVMTGF